MFPICENCKQQKSQLIDIRGNEELEGPLISQNLDLCYITATEPLLACQDCIRKVDNRKVTLERNLPSESFGQTSDSYNVSIESNSDCQLQSIKLVGTNIYNNLPNKNATKRTVFEELIHRKSNKKRRTDSHSSIQFLSENSRISIENLSSEDIQVPNLSKTDPSLVDLDRNEHSNSAAPLDHANSTSTDSSGSVNITVIPAPRTFSRISNSNERPNSAAPLNHANSTSTDSSGSVDITVIPAPRTFSRISNSNEQSNSAAPRRIHRVSLVDAASTQGIPAKNLGG